MESPCRSPSVSLAPPDDDEIDQRMTGNVLRRAPSHLALGWVAQVFGVDSPPTFAAPPAGPYRMTKSVTLAHVFERSGHATEEL